MTAMVLGILLSAGFGAGLLLAFTGFRAVRTPSLESRVLPYVRDVAIPSDRIIRSREFTDNVKVKMDSLRRAVSEAISGTAGVERRLIRAGSPQTVADFRARQWSTGVITFAAAALLGFLMWGMNHFPPTGIVGLSVAGLIAGMYWQDLRLSAAVTSYETEMAREFPVVADLLALSVAAGESPIAAVERVVKVSSGPLSRELAKLVSQIRSGGTSPEAFEALAQRVGVLSVSRFSSTMSIAIERGTPLISVLHAQTADARESTRRLLIESAGRREIFMLMPVVFLVLPTVIIFAFYPGLVALSFVSGS